MADSVGSIDCAGSPSISSVVRPAEEEENTQTREDTARHDERRSERDGTVVDICRVCCRKSCQSLVAQCSVGKRRNCKSTASMIVRLTAADNTVRIVQFYDLQARYCRGARRVITALRSQNSILAHRTNAELLDRLLDKTLFPSVVQ